MIEKGKKINKNQIDFKMDTYLDNQCCSFDISYLIMSTSNNPPDFSNENISIIQHNENIYSFIIPINKIDSLKHSVSLNFGKELLSEIKNSITPNSKITEKLVDNFEASSQKYDDCKLEKCLSQTSDME